MFDTKFVLVLAMLTTFIALGFKILLGFGVCESETKSDAIFAWDHMEVCKDLFCNFTAFKSTHVSDAFSLVSMNAYRANPTPLLTPVSSARTIFSETAVYLGRKCSCRSFSKVNFL